MRKKVSILLLALTGLFACKSDALHIKVRLDQSYGLAADDRVLFEQNHVGNVTEVYGVAVHGGVVEGRQ